MQTITITPQLENGRYYIDVPDGFTDAEFTIQITLKKEKIETALVQEKLEKIRAFAGIAASSNIKIDKSEWYQQ